MRRYRPKRGFSLMELMISMFLSSLLLSGVTLLLGSSVSAYRLQLSQDQMEESGRYAHDVLVTHISQAGYHPQPWQEASDLIALTNESVEGETSRGDQLGLQRWSSQNCYGNENPETDSNGDPKFFLLQTQFRINTAKNLAITCRFGPDNTQLQTQINNFGLVENVETMQILYAEDRDDDDIADGWVKAQLWQQENNIRAIKIALLLSSPNAITAPASEHVTLLDEPVLTPADGRLRSTSTLTAAIRGRL